MSRLPEAVGTPAPSPLVDQHGRPAQSAPAAPWKRADGTDIKPLIVVPKGQQNREYRPEVQEFEGHDVHTDEYVKRFRGRVEFPASAETGLREAVRPGLDAAVQVPVAFREGGRLRYRWKPARIGSMEAYRDFLTSPGGVGKRHLEESGGFDSDHAGGGNFYTSTPGSPTQLIDGNEFVPFLNGPFCLTGDTMIPLLDGTEVPIQELAERGGEHWVYSATPAGEVVPGRAYGARKTGERTRVVDVLLDNGDHVRCTPDHRFMLRDGTYRFASHIKPEDSLMPLYRKISDKGLPGYEMVHQPSTGRWAYTHKVVAGWTPRGSVVHHDNLNKRDNRPSNLVKMTRESHQALHMRHASWWADPAKKKAAAEKISAALKKNNWTRTPEGRARRSAEMTARFARGWRLPPRTAEAIAATTAGVRESALHSKNTAEANRKRAWTPEMRAKAAESTRKFYAGRPDRRGINLEKARAARWNHKVVSVTPAGWADVYDISVEQHSNFALTAGVFVHNSKQLYQYDYLKMHSRSFELVNHHALAAGACKIMTRFTVGRGISFSIKDERARALWDDFWERNDMRAKVRQMARDLMWQGELMLRYYEREPGKLTMRILDPSTCWEVVTDPEDFEHCLDGSTRIALLDGAEPTVEELAVSGISEENPAWTYSWDKEARRIVPGRITKCWQQPLPKRCVEVELDSGEKIVMSYDHPVLMRDGEYCWAERLQPGDSLMPLEALNNHKVVAVRDVGARVVYDIQVERHHNFALAAGIFTHNTYYYHFQWPCLRGDVRIACLDGTNPTIAELAERHERDGQPVWVYSYDEATKRIVPGEASKIWRTGTKRCVEVELDNGEKVVCSYDHPFLKRNGQYVEAEKLQPGASLMPLYRRQGYEEVWQPEARWEPTHHVVAQHTQGRKRKRGEVVHHLNENRACNTPDNLAIMPKPAHDAETSARRWANPDFLAQRSAWVKRISEAVGQHWEKGTYDHLRGSRADKVEWREGIASGVKASWQDPDKRARRLTAMRAAWARRKAAKAPNNHKVVAVRPAGEHVVYDMQVERHHNFALASGVFTHNTPYQIWTNGNIPVSKYIIQEVPPSFVQHVKINVSAQEKRGRSDLLAAMPHMKRFDDFYNGAVMKAVLEANLVYKIKVHGDFADLDQMSQDTQFTILPPPGGTWLENDAVDMTPMSAVMTASRGAQGIGQQIASIVATSLNLPTEYFNIEGGASSRATALVRTDPAVKAVEDRQQILTETLENTYDRVMEAALREGLIRPQDARRDPEVVGDEGMADQERGGEDLPFAPQAHSALPARAFAPRQQRPQARASFPGRPVRAVAVRG